MWRGCGDGVEDRGWRRGAEEGLRGKGEGKCGLWMACWGRDGDRDGGGLKGG